MRYDYGGMGREGFRMEMRVGRVEMLFSVVVIVDTDSCLIEVNL